MSQLFVFVFIVSFIATFVVSIMNIVTVKRLTKYLEEKYPKEFQERKIGQAALSGVSFFTLKNLLIRLQFLPFLILFTNRLQLDEFSTKLVERSKTLFLIIIAVGFSLILYIFINIL